MDGILNINKPQGRTSFSIVAQVRRLSRERRVGHAGTLDPAASGVLPVCLGQGTRVVEFLMDTTKAYRAEVMLGVTTDTYDADGVVIRRQDPAGLGRERIEKELANFRGLAWQTPPMYSALRYRGRRLYELARAGLEVKRQRRPTEIERLEIVDFELPLVTLEVVCGKGTYIRSLAHELGQALGCGASLKSLVRLRCGVFDIADAVSMTRLEEAFHDGSGHEFLHPIDVVLKHWGAVEVSEAVGQDIRYGRPVTLTEDIDGSYCRAYCQDGSFLAVLGFKPEMGYWQPEKVFR